MNSLPQPEEHELRASAAILPPPGSIEDQQQRGLPEMTPVEGLLLNLGRLMNDASTRGVQTPLERAFLKAGKEVFELLAENCSELAGSGAALPRGAAMPRGIAPMMVIPRSLDEDEALTSAGGARKKTTKKKTTKKKTTTRGTRKTSR